MEAGQLTKKPKDVNVNLEAFGFFQSFALSSILGFIACVPTFIISDLLKEFIWLSEIRADSEFEASVVPSDNNGTYFSNSLVRKWCLVVILGPWVFAL